MGTHGQLQGEIVDQGVVEADLAQGGLNRYCSH